MITGIALKAVIWIASSLFGKKLSEFAAGAIAAAVTFAVIVGVAGWALHSAYSYGVDQTEAKWQARALQSKLDAAKADLAAARNAEGMAKLQVASIKEKMAVEKKADADYIKELESRPAGKDGKSCGCILTDADRRGMRDGSQKSYPVKSRPSGIPGWLKGRNPGAAPAR